MGLFRYFLNLFLLAVTAWIVFRIVVRGEYRRKGSLSPLSGLLELAVWFWYMWTPYMPGKQEWGWFLTADPAPGVFQKMSGILLAGAGFLLSAGTMFRFGLPRAFGWKVDRLWQAGPYRLTRNSQIVGVCAWAAGMAILWPSGYAAGWLLLLAVPAHTMVLTEEEHLRRVFGSEYADYRRRVPRYIGCVRER